MKPASWRKKQKTQNELDTDLLRGIALLPAARLSGIDPTFAALNEGLGSAISALMSQRQLAESAKQEDTSKWKDDAEKQEDTSKRKDDAEMSSIRRVLGGLPQASQTQGPTELEAVRKRPIALEATRKNVRTLIERHNRLGAKKVTADFMSALRRSKGRSLVKAFTGETAAKAEDASETGAEEESSEDAMMEWAKAWLRMSPDDQQRAGTGRLELFCERVQHQLRCWQASRASASCVPLSLVPQPPIPKDRSARKKVEKDSQKQCSRKDRPSSRGQQPGHRPSSKGTRSRPPSRPTSKGLQERPPSRPTSKGLQERPPSRPTSKGLQERPPSRPTSFCLQERPLRGHPSSRSQWPGKAGRPLSRGNSSSLGSRPGSSQFQRKTSSSSSLGSRPGSSQFQRKTSRQLPALPSLSAAVSAELASTKEPGSSTTFASIQLPSLRATFTSEQFGTAVGHGRRPHKLRTSSVFRATRLATPASDKAPSQELLRRTQPLLPSQNVSVSATPEFAYLRTCEMAGLIPCPEAWRRFGEQGIIDATRVSLSDIDAAALVEMAVKHAAAGHPFRDLNLSYNRITDHGLLSISRLLEVAKAPPGTHQEGATCGNPAGADTPDDACARTRCCNQLSSLNLAGNPGLKFRASGLTEVWARALSSLPALDSLNLSAIPLKGKPAVCLAETLSTYCPGLRSLSLAGCGLGLVDQSDCSAVAALLGPGANAQHYLGLERADFSGNFFGWAGFSTAAASVRRDARLKSLSFASNYAWNCKDNLGNALHSCNDTVDNVNHVGIDHTPQQQQQQQQMTQLNPLQLLLEALQCNGSLEELDIANCFVGPDTAFVLEESLRAHPRLGSINLEDNPLGEDGLQCVLRLILRDGNQSLSKILASGHREDTAKLKVNFSPTLPWGNHKLNLKLPSDRATLRYLLGLSEASSRAYGGRYIKFDSKQGKPFEDKDPETGVWTVRTHGSCSVTYLPPLSQACLRRLKRTKVHCSESKPLPPLKANLPEAKLMSLLRETARETASVDANGLPTGDKEKSASFCASKSPASKSEEAPTWRFGAMVVESLAGEQKAEQSTAPATENQPQIPPWWPQQIHQVVPGSEGTPEGDWSELLQLSMEFRRPVSTLRFDTVQQMFESLRTEAEQRRFIGAMCRDFKLTLAQARNLCDGGLAASLSTDLLSVLLPCIDTRASQLEFLASLPTYKSQPLTRLVDSFLWFAVANPTGHYSLDLSAPADFVVANSCFLLSAWEAEVAKSAGRADMSQHGNWDMIRNQTYNDVSFVNSRDWATPCHGWLRFDYSSMARPSPDVQPMPEVMEVLKQFRTDSLSSSQKLRALRTISVHMFLSARQCKQMLLCFTADSSLSFEQGVREESRARQDAFCMLHTRVFDRDALLGPEMLYATRQLLTSQEQSLVAQSSNASPPSGKGRTPRRGRKASNQADNQDIDSGGSPASKKTVREAKKLIARSRGGVSAHALEYIEKKRAAGQCPLTRADQKALVGRLGILHLLNPIRPEIPQIECHLEAHDHQKFLEFYVQLSSVEPGGRVLAWADTGKQVNLPARWSETGVPRKDARVTVSYESWGPQLATRFAVAELYTVGFYGPGLGEKPLTLVPAKLTAFTDDEYH